MAARGGAGTPLGLSVLCAPRGTADEALSPASTSGCPVEGVVSFAYRVAPRTVHGAQSLAVFGVDARGAVHYYAPTPVDPPLVADLRDRWANTGVAVDLSINHVAGRVRVYALLTRQPLAVADIDGLAARMRAEKPASPSAATWLERLRPADRPTACQDINDCEAAETSFVIGRTKAP